MHSTQLPGLGSLSMTGYLFGMLYNCPHTCDPSCPLASVRQGDLVTTFYYLKSLSHDDKTWLLYRYQHCPIRLGESAANPAHDMCEGLGRGHDLRLTTDS